MLLITLISGTCMIIVGYLSAQTGAGLARDLRRNVFQQVESFSATEFDKFSTASLITRSTNDINQIQMVVIVIMRMVFYAPIIAIGGIIRATQTSANMWWIIALAVVVLLGLIISVFTIALPKFKIIQSLLDRLNLVVRENLSGMMVIRAFNMQSFEETRFDKANLDVTRNYLFVNRVMVIMMPLMMLIMNIVTITILWVGAHQVAEANIQVGDMMAFMQYAMQILFSFLMLAMIFIMLPRAAVSGDRVADVLETEPVIKDPQQPQQFAEPFKGSVEFRNVSFKYEEKPVLQNVTFMVKAGESVAIVGPSGAGKTTIANVLLRFYEVVSGGIFIDGVNIKERTVKSMREQMAIVTQETILFNDSVFNNIAYGSHNKSEGEVIAAAKAAFAHEFIERMPQGYKTIVGEQGARLSGGQRQKIAIARAILKGAPILILDEATSSLDSRSEKEVQGALENLMQGKTTIMIAHRLSTVRNANRIIVMAGGTIAEEGTHQELLLKKGLYYTMDTIQSTPPEKKQNLAQTG